MYSITHKKKFMIFRNKKINFLNLRILFHVEHYITKTGIKFCDK